MLMASLNSTTRIEQQGDTRVAFADAPMPAPRTASRGAPHRNPFSGGLVGDIIGLFGYAEAPSSASVNAAVDAATAVATRAPDLEDWRASVDDDARKIKLGLGTFDDKITAISVAESFAMLGAVDEDQVDENGRRATRLTLTHLKPGVARADVVTLAHKLGLTDLVLY
jgi:rare lipoprotein A